ncbi:MAG: biotin--[acetyl-CoA-carboxylase] ligase [SAR324 cluster bacterium]|nr:biotin--[acetyl-CoA-carboxylase] ligase [SAR324 cluster bacterium]
MPALRTTIGERIIRFEEVDSTNSFLMREKEHLNEHGLVVTTAFQNGGRGRRDRKFIALPGKNITFSVVIHPSPKVEEISIYSLLAGIAVVRSLKSYTVIPPRLKWPNDVLVNRRKICGILLEAAPSPMLHSPVLVIGIGINCLGKSSDYPEMLQKSVTTLEEESNKSFNQESIFQEVLKSLGDVIDELENRGSAHLLQEWIAHSNAIGALVEYEKAGTWAEGCIEGLTAVGYLLIRDKSGELHTHISGDVVYSDHPYRSQE